MLFYARVIHDHVSEKLSTLFSSPILQVPQSEAFSALLPPAVRHFTDTDGSQEVRESVRYPFHIIKNLLT